MVCMWNVLTVIDVAIHKVTTRTCTCHRRINRRRSHEGLILPQLIREGVGQRCYYCWTKTGYSVNFTSLGQYAKHVLYNHDGFSIYVFDEDVKKYKEELKALKRKQRDYPKQFRQPSVSSSQPRLTSPPPFL